MYRVSKEINSEGKVRWFPFARVFWFPIWFRVEGTYEDRNTEDGAWGLCKLHAQGHAELDVASVIAPLVIVVMCIGGFLLIVITKMGVLNG